MSRHWIRRITRVCSVVFVGLGLGMASVVPAQAAAGSSTLSIYEGLRAGEYLVKGNYQLIYRSDGDLALYNVHATPQRLCWHSDTAGVSTGIVLFDYNMGSPALVIRDAESQVRGSWDDINGGVVELRSDGSLWVGENQISVGC